MTTQPYRFYADSQTREDLERSADRILLLGGFLGYHNFGDILQLKSVIRWHRVNSHREPVVVCDLAAISDGDYPRRLREWLDVVSILFFSAQPVDASAIGLDEVTEPYHAPRLHLYGGGYLNARWGEMMLSLSESVQERFGVGHYVMSGLQVDASMADRLTEHVACCKPKLAGGRDPESVGILTRSGAPTTDSFDDAIEAMQALAEIMANVPPAGASDALVHLNLSDYSGRSRNTLQQTAEILGQLHAHIVRQGEARPRITLLQAYSDRRISMCTDTLAVIQQLEDQVPTSAWRGADLAQMALGLWTGQQRRVVNALSAPIAVSSSYHVALFCNMLGVPCYLQANNEYYRQKKSGLGLAIEDLDSFLKSPGRLPLAARMQVRSSWLGRLAEVYEYAPIEREPVVPEVSWTGQVMLWHPKRSDTECLQEDIDRTREELMRCEAARQQLADGWQIQKDWIDQLEAERDSLNTEAKRLGDGWTKQQQRIEELEKAKDDLWKQLQLSDRELKALHEAVGRFEQKGMARALLKFGLLKRIDANG